MLKIISLFIYSAFFIIPVTGIAGEGERLLDKFFVETKTMQAGFTQSLSSSEGEMMQESKGQFFLHKPGKFRWNYTHPYAQEIVSNGEKIWIYDVDLQQVTVQKQSVVLANTPMALLQDKISVNAAYKIRELDNSGGVYRLLLSAKDDSGDFKNIILGVSEKGLKFMQLKDQFDQSTDIVFFDISTNQSIDTSTFEFVVPAGADVFGGS